MFRNMILHNYTQVQSRRLRLKKSFPSKTSFHEFSSIEPSWVFNPEWVLSRFIFYSQLCLNLSASFNTVIQSYSKWCFHFTHPKHAYYLYNSTQFELSQLCRIYDLYICEVYQVQFVIVSLYLLLRNSSRQYRVLLLFFPVFYFYLFFNTHVTFFSNLFFFTYGILFVLFLYGMLDKRK